MNVDAALSPSKASIVVIAHNSMGSIIKAWTKQVPLLDTIVVKAMAIVWALELALSQKFAKVTINLLRVMPKCVWRICLTLLMVVAGRSGILAFVL